MESKNTEKPNPPITKHLVTYRMIALEGNFAPTELHTETVVGDIEQWHLRMSSDPTFKCIIDFALYLW